MFARHQLAGHAERAFHVTADQKLALNAEVLEAALAVPAFYDDFDIHELLFFLRGPSTVSVLGALLP